MSRLYRRPDSKVWWMAFNYDGKEIRQSTGTSVKKKARLVLDERCGDIRDANYVENQEDVTFHDLKEWILEDYRDNGLRSINTLQHNLKTLERFFGCYHATKITVDRVNVYRSTMLREGLSKATINRHVAALSRMFTLGVKRQRLRHKPKFEMYEENNARQGFLSHAEFQALYPHLDDWDFRKTWCRARQAAKCAFLLVHDFRRSAVKNLIRARVPEKVAMEITGHRTRSVFDRYHIVDESDMRAALEQTQAYLDNDTSELKVRKIGQ